MSFRGLAVRLLPALILAAGAGVASGASTTESRALAVPLERFPREIAGYRLTQRIDLDSSVRRVLAADQHIYRRYRRQDGDAARLDVFVAYYGRQTAGSTIHSPRNCLPGSGWEPTEHRRVPITTSRHDGTVNRYVVTHEDGRRALVYYWYQGRGRIAANEYLVKWDLLRDGLLRRRTDEALVRVVVPLPRDRGSSGVEAEGGIPSVVRAVADSLWRHLPEG